MRSNSHDTDGLGKRSVAVTVVNVTRLGRRFDTYPNCDTTARPFEKKWHLMNTIGYVWSVRFSTRVTAA
jgi:hypothetical protein